MRTFKLTLGIDVKAVVPQHVTDAWRADAQSEEATPFLKNVQALYPDDDEAFTLHILKHGTRATVRASLKSLYEGTGIGGTLSPVSAGVIDLDATPVLASEIEAALDGTLPTEHLG